MRKCRFAKEGVIQCLFRKEVAFLSLMLLLLSLASCSSQNAHETHKDAETSKRTSTTESFSTKELDSLGSASESSFELYNDIGNSVNSGESDQSGEHAYLDEVVDWRDASTHIGEVVTVRGKVVSTKYASTSKGSPTFLDMGAPYPDRSRVTITIWRDSRSTFPSPPESAYRGATVCVTGEVYLHNGICNIEVSSPSQISVIK